MWVGNLQLRPQHATLQLTTRTISRMTARYLPAFLYFFSAAKEEEEIARLRARRWRCCVGGRASSQVRVLQKKPCFLFCRSKGHGNPLCVGTVERGNVSFGSVQVSGHPPPASSKALQYTSSKSLQCTMAPSNFVNKRKRRANGAMGFFFSCYVL